MAFLLDTLKEHQDMVETKHVRREEQFSGHFSEFGTFKYNHMNENNNARMDKEFWI